MPVVGETDVLVIGGGPAGIGAAIGAAKTGARVTLVERYGFLGGNATASLVEIAVGIGSESINGFIKNGAGLLRLSNNTNAFTGSITLQAGIERSTRKLRLWRVNSSSTESIRTLPPLTVRSSTKS